MKTSLLKTFLEDKRPCGVTLLLCACLLLFAFTPGAAQVKSQRRVTGLQLDGAAEGSRVTIVSDTALNDYEAYRRGDRFYVKIPLADFASTVPHLRANGFEDVQVQKAGDGLIASFKLQPGASARVDQRGNRLDVVFSAADRSSYNVRNGVVQSGNVSGSSARGRDTAGPMPPGSIGTSRDRFVTDRGAGASRSQSSQDTWASTSRSGTDRNAKGVTSNQSTALSSPSPVSSPSSVLSPGTSSTYTPLTSATPAVSPVVRPAIAGSGEFLNWRQRGNAAWHWAAAHRLVTALAALILLGLLLYVFWLFRNRQEQGGKAKQAKTLKVQPKYSGERELYEIFSRVPSERTARAEGRSTTPSSESPAIRVSSDADLRNQPAKAQAASANARASQKVLTKPTITLDEHREEEEREVFEL